MWVNLQTLKIQIYVIKLLIFKVLERVLSKEIFLALWVTGCDYYLSGYLKAKPNTILYFCLYISNAGIFGFERGTRLQAEHCETVTWLEGRIIFNAYLILVLREDLEWNNLTQITAGTVVSKSEARSQIFFFREGCAKRQDVWNPLK